MQRMKIRKADIAVGQTRLRQILQTSVFLNSLSLLLSAVDSFDNSFQDSINDTDGIFIQFSSMSCGFTYHLRSFINQVMAGCGVPLL
jgi:hypothetical protein